MTKGDSPLTTVEQTRGVLLNPPLNLGDLYLYFGVAILKCEMDTVGADPDRQVLSLNT